MRRLAKLGVHGVDAVGQQHPPTGVDVGRGKADLAALPSPLMTVPLMAKFRPSIWPASSSHPSRTASRMRVLLTAWPSSATACRPCT